MKKHKVFIFSGPNGESWQGDCPKWVAETKVSRPDLTLTISVAYGKRWSCTACNLGHH